MSDRDEITALRLQEVDGSNERLNEINKGYDDAMRQDPDQTEQHSYMSEIDETEIMAAKKRLNF